MRLLANLFLAMLALASSGLTHASAFPIVGFGSSATGGEGGVEVVIDVREENSLNKLKTALCDTMANGRCTDKTKRIIKLRGNFNFIGSEKTATVKGCHATAVCASPHRSEVTLLMHPTFTHCKNSDGTDKPQWDVTYDVAGANPLLVGSNKTLIGDGPMARIQGKGLMLDQVENVIIRNLIFSDINQGLVFGGDAIRLNTSKRVVIDHNHFTRIGRAMISTGHTSGVSVDEVTISWNRFDGRNVYSPGCNGKHYWSLLLQGDGRVTFANNWLNDFSGRGPKIIGNAFYHAYNNYFEQGSWHAFDIGTDFRTPNSIPHVLMESNYFVDVNTPSVVNTGAKAAKIYAIGGRLSKSQKVAAGQLCTAYLNRGCVLNQALNAQNEGFPRDSAVLAKAKNVRADIEAELKASGLPSTLLESRFPRPVSSSVVKDLVTRGAGVGKI